jgi:hypothetical protein
MPPIEASITFWNRRKMRIHGGRPYNHSPPVQSEIHGLASHGVQHPCYTDLGLDLQYSSVYIEVPHSSHSECTHIHTVCCLTYPLKMHADDRVFSDNQMRRISWSKVFQSFIGVENIAIICQGPLFDADEAVTVVPDIIGDGNPTLVRVECWSSPYVIKLGPTLQVTDMTYHGNSRVQYVFSRDPSKTWKANPEETPMISADQNLRVSRCGCCKIRDYS